MATLADLEREIRDLKRALQDGTYYRLHAREHRPGGHDVLPTASDLTAHLNDTTDAHDASAISILDTAADFTATDVEGALAELQADNEAHVAAADPHTGYVKENDANYVDLTDGGATALHSHAGGSGHTIRENGTDQTARTGLNFVDAAAGAGLITDDAGNNETEVNLNLYVLKANADYVDLTDGGATTLHSHAGGSGHTIQDDDAAMTARTNLSFQDGFTLTDDAGGNQTEIDLAFGAAGYPQDVATTEADGTAITVARSDHVHKGPHAGIDTTSMKQTMVILGWLPTTTSGAGNPEIIEVGSTNKHDFLACPFDSTSAESAFATVVMPDNWDASTITFRVWWLVKTGYVVTSSDGVAWTLKGTAYADGDPTDTAYGTGVTVTDTGDANNDVNKTADSSALTIGNTPSAGELVHFVLTRTVSDAADDWAADAYPLAVVIEYGITALST